MASWDSGEVHRCWSSIRLEEFLCGRKRSSSTSATLLIIGCSETNSSSLCSCAALPSLYTLLTSHPLAFERWSNNPSARRIGHRNAHTSLPCDKALSLEHNHRLKAHANTLTSGDCKANHARILLPPFGLFSMSCFPEDIIEEALYIDIHH